VAFLIFTLSIVWIPSSPRPILIDFSIILLYRTNLFLGESFLESLRPIMPWSSGNITAEATTGPANGPLPTSSTPAIFSVVAIFVSL